MLANASFLVPSLCKDTSPTDKSTVYVKLYLCFLQNTMFFPSSYINIFKSFFSDLNTFFNRVLIFQVYYL
jgi:hypothetical protein